MSQKGDLSAWVLTDKEQKKAWYLNDRLGSGKELFINGQPLALNGRFKAAPTGRAVLLVQGGQRAQCAGHLGSLCACL